FAEEPLGRKPVVFFGQQWCSTNTYRGRIAEINRGPSLVLRRPCFPAMAIPAGSIYAPCRSFRAGRLPHCEARVQRSLPACMPVEAAFRKNCFILDSIISPASEGRSCDWSPLGRLSERIRFGAARPAASASWIPLCIQGAYDDGSCERRTFYFARA